MKLIRSMLSLVRRGVRRMAARPYVGRRDRLSQAGERSILESHMRNGF